MSRPSLHPATPHRGAAARAGLCAGLAICLAAALGGCSRSAAPAGAPPAGLWGVVPQQRTTLAQLERLRRGGVAGVRIGVEWRSIEPRAGGPPRWSEVDEAVRNATRAGLRVLPYVYGSPRWLAPAETSLPVASAGQRRAWARFLRALVGRYGPGGGLWRRHPDLPRRPIRAWQIWNEPNFFYFADPPDPGAYDRLLELSRRAIRGADQGARLILGGLFATPRQRPPLAYPAHRFLALMYRRDPGIGRSIDGVAVHPYTGGFRRLTPILDRIRATLRRVGDPRAGLWITELGWGSRAGRGAGSLEKGRLGQARQLKGAFRLLRAHRARWRLRGVYWFAATDSGSPDACDFCRSAGLFTAGFRPKPAWRAFVRSARG